MVTRTDSFRLAPQQQLDTSVKKEAVKVDSNAQGFKSQFEAAKLSRITGNDGTQRSIAARGHVAAALERGKVEAGRRALHELGKPVQEKIDTAVKIALESGMVTKEEAADMRLMIAGAMRANGIA